MTITLPMGYLPLPFSSSSSESGMRIGPDAVRDVAGGGESSPSVCGWGVEATSPGDMAFLMFGVGGGIGNGCKVCKMGVGVLMDSARRGTKPFGTLGANLALVAFRGATMGVGAVEETEIGLPAVEAMKIGVVAVEATKIGRFLVLGLTGPGGRTLPSPPYSARSPPESSGLRSDLK